MARMPDGSILCVYERAKRVHTRRSRDEGRTWEDERTVVGFAFGVAANPEILVLANGWTLIAYNERPEDGVHPYAIRIVTSPDGGETWRDPRLVYEAGSERGTGCWEPSLLQIPWGRGASVLLEREAVPGYRRAGDHTGPFHRQR